MKRIALWCGLLAAVFSLANDVPASAASNTAFYACVVTATTTATGLKSLLSTAGCTTGGVEQCVKLKVIGATSVCVGGATSTGDPAALAAGNQCYPLVTGEQFPGSVQSGQMSLRVQSGTSLVSVAIANGC